MFFLFHSFGLKKLLPFLVAAIFLNACTYQRICIVPNAPIAKIAQAHFGEPSAITIGNAIFVSGNCQEILVDSIWLNHEIHHVEQYRQIGVVKFILLWTLLWMKFGYNQHPLE